MAQAADLVDIGRILCPIDFSEPSKYAVEHAVASATWYGAQITLVHVYSTLLPCGPVARDSRQCADTPAGEFVHLMATHHHMVMDVALLERGQGKSPDVKALATAIWESRQRDLPALDAFKGKLSEAALSHERE